MVEGGGPDLDALEQGLVDELQTFIGNMVIGGKDAPRQRTAPVSQGGGFCTVTHHRDRTAR